MIKSYGIVEKKLLHQKRIIAGVDEVGRGALAGPVYAGAAVLDYKKLLALDKAELSLIRDSKSLSRPQREKSLILINKIALTHTTAFADVHEIEMLGIVQATFLAMKRALGQLTLAFDILLIDGKFPIPEFDREQLSLIGGDRTCYAIAAASILAKEARDTVMREEGNRYPNYGFENHVGYATGKHLEAIRNLGACSLHRKNFEPIKSLLP